MSPADAGDALWYKDAIIYELHVKAFFDSNNDGIGDFRGLTAKLDYLQELGVNTLWLLPFYPSPQRDDGYDIADYRNIHPDYGTRKDFQIFVREAHRRGLRIITELVVNHTSDEHPWFQAARRAPAGSSKRNFYVWSQSDKKWPETRIIFTDTETSNWAWDPLAKAYYWHRFFSHQPDLNLNSPSVVRAVTRAMRFWFDYGVDGVRLDAIPYLCERAGTNNENLPETHAVVKEFRRVVDRYYGDRIFLAEANQWPEDVRDYFGDGDECHMAYHFPLMPRIYIALMQEDRHPIVEIMNQTPDIPENCQWAIFLRNHDELTLEMVTDKERDYMWQMYAADRRMRINVGIRRRLAPLMENNRARIELMNSLLMSMPGSPIVYYGDEIGMGDNIYLGDRNGVRTPMQWSPDRNAGFSRADPARLYLPPIMDSVYGFEAVNVEAQAASPASLLNWTRRLIAVRKEHPAFGRGTLKFLHPGNRKVLAYLREYQDDVVLCVANLGRSAQPVELDLAAYRGLIPMEMTGRTVFPPIGELPYLLTLPGHNFYWFTLTQQAHVPSWHTERLPPKELPMLVLFDGWSSFFPDQVEPARRPFAQRMKRQLLEEILPNCLPTQRWFAAKGEPFKRMDLAWAGRWSAAGESWLLAMLEVETGGGQIQHYALPLTLLWDTQDESRLTAVRPSTLARVRQRERLGFIGDAYADPLFVRALIRAIGANEEIPLPNGRLRCTATSAYAVLVPESLAEDAVRPASADSTNTAILVGKQLFLKAYRRLPEGLSAELEIGRFLTECTGFKNTVPVAGAIEHLGDDGMARTLVIVQGQIVNQGSGWAVTMTYLKRFFEELDAALSTHLAPPVADHGYYAQLASTLGRRVAELHHALATPTDDADFSPEPVDAAELARWRDDIVREAELTLAALRSQAEYLPEDARTAAARLLARGDQLTAGLAATWPAQTDAVKTRFHGDLHLGQVLVAENDFYIIDFEGEPERPLAERRSKQSPLKDVAGMLRSFDYAASAALRDLAASPRIAALRDAALVFEQIARDALLTGYREAIAGCPSYPAEDGVAAALIESFSLQKALYELRYELANRPDWVELPLNALLRAVEAQTR